MTQYRSSAAAPRSARDRGAPASEIRCSGARRNDDPVRGVEPVEVESRLMRRLTVLGFALAAVAALPTAGATKAPTGRIAFSMGNQNRDVYAVNADGSGLVRLTDDPAADFDPSWSPDGRRIAYRHEDEQSGQIYVMDADGSRQRSLTRRP